MASSAIHAGDRDTCARMKDGSMQCWGDDSDGQLGDGKTTARLSPTPIVGVSDATQVAVGGWTFSTPFQCAVVGTDGEVWCWGNNDYGQLGDGTVTSRATPAPVSSSTGTKLTGVASVALGNAFACALMGGTGDVKCWGNNGAGELGVPTATHQSAVPLAIAGLTGATSISANGYDVCALVPGTTSGAGTIPDQVSCWGSNALDQLGPDGPAAGSSALVTVPGLPARISWLAAGADHFCVVATADGSVMCWGGNPAGQLGDGTTTTTPTPTPVVGIGGTGTLEGVVEIRGGDQFTCARINDGAAACWGYGGVGNLGDSSTVSPMTTPTMVDGRVGGDPFVHGRQAARGRGDGTGHVVRADGRRHGGVLGLQRGDRHRDAGVGRVAVGLAPVGPATVGLATVGPATVGLGTSLGTTLRAPPSPAP
jgi:alpha-tubulin suppressor-like RCC1 family protein